ncbi:hypothetical protein [Ferrimonas balearica]|uniref:hypothetical protein n=1 Tax=Ferrimonas balearica TaxID=44012 RepID=UPI001C57E99E|nr:hypothetical protein [Ferrimonas balearica]MBW3139335.1 hypothetical protein [Ferrimonas balearica]MBW3163075.1 hypothetical protein [Ferrimonas balearica]MBY6106403.1 hypothetical protein [Ferrimonas balearica]MBY6223020.1 hypothetical protein [Ferrimonas balearica]
MVKGRNLIALAALGAALVVAYQQMPMPQVAQLEPGVRGELRTEVHRSSEVLGPGLAYYRSANTPPPTGEPAADVDINVLIQDFPTAAGEIHQQVLLDQQYQAALNGDHEQAMKLMAESFRSGEGSGSYRTRW